MLTFKMHNKSKKWLWLFAHAFDIEKNHVSVINIGKHALLAQPLFSVICAVSCSSKLHTAAAAGVCMRPACNAALPHPGSLQLLP